jgi:acylphosphatase
VRLRFLISGQVQGVGFRAFAFRKATGLGLRGYCRNLVDGRVEVVADGEEASLAGLERELAQGPRLARVSSVDKAEILDEMTSYNTFSIK